MYSEIKLKIWNVGSLYKVADILYKCGKDMAVKYDLHHWDNSHLKNWLIVLMCALKNDIYLVFDNKTPVATFQIQKKESSLLFQKLATVPEFAGKGVGSFCLNKIEQIGRERGCSEIVCEVYDKSKHAIQFYEHKGYTVYGTVETLKYNELKMIKKL